MEHCVPWASSVSGKMKTIRCAEKSDWDDFLVLAELEGWRVPEVESQLFRESWTPFAQVMELEQTFCGLVTAVAYQRSGWIGNLIVPVELRGQGCGRQLFDAAISALQAQRLESIWLTASEMGRPIYEKAGFVTVDRVERWISGTRGTCAQADFLDNDALQQLRAADLAAWGEDRSALLEALCLSGRAFACDDSVALLQYEPGLQIIGPWYSPSCCPRANRRLLQTMLSAVDPHVEIIVDVLASTPLRQLLAAAGFACAGKNLLMVLGDAGHARRDMMVSLASLGSIG